MRHRKVARGAKHFELMADSDKEEVREPKAEALRAHGRDPRPQPNLLQEYLGLYKKERAPAHLLRYGSMLSTSLIDHGDGFPMCRYPRVHLHIVQNVHKSSRGPKSRAGGFSFHRNVDRHIIRLHADHYIDVSIVPLPITGTAQTSST